MDIETTILRPLVITSMVLFSVSGCSKSKPSHENDKWANIELESDTELSFWTDVPESQGTPGGPDPLILCDLQGPHDTLVLARMLTDAEGHPLAPGCDPDDDPYAASYASFEVEVLETAAGRDDVPSPVALVTFGSQNGGIPELSEGPTILAAIREADGTWFVDHWVYADVMNSDVGSRSSGSTGTDLPTTWGTLVQESTDINSDFSQACGFAPAGEASYNDSEYYDYRYVREQSKPGCEENGGTPTNAVASADAGTGGNAGAGGQDAGSN